MAMSVVRQELEDLSGLIADVAGKVRRDEPGLAGEIAKALRVSAAYFEYIERQQSARSEHVAR